MKRNLLKLSLAKETLRVLADEQMRPIAAAWQISDPTHCYPCTLADCLSGGWPASDACIPSLVGN